MVPNTQFDDSQKDACLGILASDPRATEVNGCLCQAFQTSEWTWVWLCQCNLVGSVLEGRFEDVQNALEGKPVS